MFNLLLNKSSNLFFIYAKIKLYGDEKYARKM